MRVQRALQRVNKANRRVGTSRKWKRLYRRLAERAERKFARAWIEEQLQSMTFADKPYSL